VLHIDVRVVKIDTGERVAILQGHIVGLDTDDGLSVRQLLNGGVQV
jgi:hypothetical protein